MTDTKKIRESFGTLDIPKTLQLSSYEFIADVPHFIESHILHIENNKQHDAYLKRLQRLYKKLTETKNEKV